MHMRTSQIKRHTGQGGGSQMQSSLALCLWNQGEHYLQCIMCSTGKLHWALVSKLFIGVLLHRHDWLIPWPRDWTWSPTSLPSAEVRCFSSFDRFVVHLWWIGLKIFYHSKPLGRSVIFYSEGYHLAESPNPLITCLVFQHPLISINSGVIEGLMNDWCSKDLESPFQEPGTEAKFSFIQHPLSFILLHPISLCLSLWRIVLGFYSFLI